MKITMKLPRNQEAQIIPARTLSIDEAIARAMSDYPDWQTLTLILTRIEADARRRR